jgi:hypothetical protein
VLKVLSKDVFFRSHVVELETKEPLTSNYSEPKWPEYVLVFDTETTLDPQNQALLFGFYRVCRLRGKAHECVEEGVFPADDLTEEYLHIINDYVRTRPSEVASSDYDERIHVYSRSEFVEKVFFEAIRILHEIGLIQKLVTDFKQTFAHQSQTRRH